MLKVSYCDQSMSLVHRPSFVVHCAASTIVLKAYSYTPWPMDLKLGRKHLGAL